MRRHRWVSWGLGFGCWTLFGVILASQAYISNSTSGRPSQWREMLTWGLAETYTWAALSPFIIWLAKRFPFERGNWMRSLLVHVPVGVLVSILQMVLKALVRQYTFWSPTMFHSFSEDLLYSLTNRIVSNLQIYWAVVGISSAALFYRRYRDKELRESQLETQLAQSRLDALRMQLHPHFLFNTLHAISVLMRRDVEAANQMLVHLSDMLRVTLHGVGGQEVSLRRELEFLESYLEIEKARLHERLTVEIQIDSAALDARVPSLILQPLVENAIRHGIAPRAAGGRVEIRAERKDGAVELQVIDNGLGIREKFEGKLAEGIGLSNTKARLEHLYGESHRFELSRAVGGGLRVTVMIPYRAQPSSISSEEGAV